MNCWISLIILLIIGLISYNKKDKLFLYFSIWCVFILFDMWASKKKFGGISPRFDGIFAVFLIAVYVTYYFISLLLRNSRHELVIKYPYPISFKLYYKLCITISLMFIFIGLIQIGGFDPNILRETILGREVSFHSGVSSALLASAMYYANYYGEKKEKVIIALFLIITSLLSTSKIFLIVAVLYIVPWYVRGYKFNVKQLIIILVGAFIGFYIYNGLTERIVGSGSFFSKVIYTMNGYLIGGIEIFQRYLDNDLISPIPGWFKTGMFVTNVQSIFWVIYREKTIGMYILLSSCIGAIYGFLSVKIESFRFLKVYSLFPIFFIFFDDLFFKSFAQWACFIFAGILLFIIKPENKKKKEID